MFYTFEPKRNVNYQAYVGDAFDISHHPVKMAQMAAGALIFLRGDVRAAKTMIKRNYSSEQLLESMRLPISESPYYTPGFPTSMVLQHQVRIGSMEESKTKPVHYTKTDPLVSDTKELKWYSGAGKNGLVIIESPKSQGMIGFVNTQNLSLKNIDALLHNEFCAITLSSLDSKPIASAGELLLTTGARVENSGLIWNANRTKVINRGTSPSLMEPVKGQIILKGLLDAKAVRVMAIDGSGSPLKKEIKVAHLAAGWAFNIGDTVTPWYKISVLR